MEFVLYSGDFQAVLESPLSLMDDNRFIDRIL